MDDLTFDLILPPQAVANLEDLACIRGQNLTTTIADAVAEVLLRERLDYACFRSTMAMFDGLVPDGTVRVQPMAEA